MKILICSVLVCVVFYQCSTKSTSQEAINSSVDTEQHFSAVDSTRKNDIKVFQIANDTVSEMYIFTNSDSLMASHGTFLSLIKKFRKGTRIDGDDRYGDSGKTNYEAYQMDSTFLTIWKAFSYFDTDYQNEEFYLRGDSLLGNRSYSMNGKQVEEKIYQFRENGCTINTRNRTTDSEAMSINTPYVIDFTLANIPFTIEVTKGERYEEIKQQWYEGTHSGPQ